MNKNRISNEQKSNIKRQKNQIPNEKSIKYQIDIFETNGLPYMCLYVGLQFHKYSGILNHNSITTISSNSSYNNCCYESQNEAMNMRHKCW